LSRVFARKLAAKLLLALKPDIFIALFIYRFKTGTVPAGVAPLEGEEGGMSSPFGGTNVNIF
jgi:hypothetical protein